MNHSNIQDIQDIQDIQTIKNDQDSRFSLPFIRYGFVVLLAAWLLFDTLSHIAWAHGVQAGTLDIRHPYASATTAAQTVGGVYFKAINNTGDTSDALVAASVDAAIAASASLHVMNTDADTHMMRMRAVSAIELPAKTSVAMTRGLMQQGYHIMLMGLKKPLIAGETLPLTLQFAKAGTVKVLVKIE